MARRVVKAEAPAFTKKLTPESIGQFIRARRTQLGYDLQTVATSCGVSIATLSHLENATKDVRLSTVLKVCDMVGVRLKVEPWKGAEA